MSGAIIGVHDKIDYPRQCYNAQNHWELGWYDAERMQTVTPGTAGTLVRVVAFADIAVAEATADKVLVQTGENLDLYMQYNRAKGFNAQTYEYQDKLVIVRDNGGGTKIEATLDLDNESVYTVQENANKNPLRIEVCSQFDINSATKPDYLMVSIGYSSSSLCKQLLAQAANKQQTSVDSVTGGSVTGGALTGGAFTGLGFFTTQQAVCIKSGQDCSFDSECCTNTCHNDSCGGGLSSISKDFSKFIPGYNDHRQRGGRRGLRGLKGATTRLVVD
jgi:hypothetical protein